MSCYILHHYKRQKAEYKKWCFVYYENYKWNNICPYIFNKEFIHTFCKTPTIKKEEWNINFWINAEWNEEWTKIEKVLCDIVFKIKKDGIIYWERANDLRWSKAKIILWYKNSQSHQYQNHFSWYGQHILKRQQRVSLFADKKESFQPQDENWNLVDIKDLLEVRYWKNELRKLLKPKRWIWVRRIELSDKDWATLYQEIISLTNKRIFWKDLSNINPRRLTEIDY